MNRVDLAPNRFKEALSSGPAQIGLWLALANPYSTEIVGGAGFDWLVLDGEHAPNHLRSLLSQLQALAAHPVMPVVRPPVGDPVVLKQILDIGAQTVLVPMVESANQARALVAAVRYPPQGIRGVGAALARASRWNRIPDYVHKANANVCLLVQVESQAGLDHLDEIARVEGVDGVFIGPADLAASLGHLGDAAHPEVQRAIDEAIGRIRNAGKAPGILAFEERSALRYLELGCRFVAVGAELSLLARAAETLARRFTGAIAQSSVSAPKASTSPSHPRDSL